MDNLWKTIDIPVFSRYFTDMKKKRTRAEVYQTSHDKVRQFARRMNYSIPEAYSVLSEFGMEKLEKMKARFQEQLDEHDGGNQVTDERGCASVAPFQGC